MSYVYWNNMQIIGLRGTKGSGKDKVCRLKKGNERKGQLKREACADRLKQGGADTMQVRVERTE